MLNLSIPLPETVFSALHLTPEACNSSKTPGMTVR
jgi:hypothetical protein